MGKTLFLLAVAPMAAIAPAQAQTGGIQVAPVLVEMAPSHGFASLRVRNGRSHAAAFEADVFAWSQVNGEDVLTPSNALLAAPGVFEIPAGGDQVVRLAVPSPDPQRELAFRLILRELPTQRRDGARLGFTLEMSLPVFVTPSGARAMLQTRTETRGLGVGLVITNEGDAHAQILSVDDMDSGALAAPRYLLAGGSAEVTLSARTNNVRMRFSELSGSQAERIIHVDRPDSRASVR
jgi:fimbrial chaperone protein